ncbi:glycolate oxidase subunit GlcE [Sphingomonas profundi]|uniref:glycolate oxidase subunit GlcE n=1 Tax=Alterirhizorhabdus profundi TaxID=2681549 RepID=UPI0012E781D8|nr:glycolate oxidase subunit GlcE [Sphingomonas profundi]
MAALRPESEEELVRIVSAAASAGERLALRGGGSKAGVGAPEGDATILDMGGFAGVIDYDPAELVLTVGAGTPLAQVQALVAGEDQMLAFDPFDHGPVFGAAEGAATIGGVVAAGVAGSRRVSAGGARDHLLGFTAVSGRGERFVAGAKVVKNVTGYDLPKLVCGSWGRLVALTELTLKVLPRPRETVTRLYRGLPAERGLATITAAMRSQASVAAAAHVPGDLAGGSAITALRLEGFGPSIAARLAMLDDLIGPGDDDGGAHDAVWRDVRTLAPLDDGRPLWRVSLPAGGCPPVIAALRPDGARYLIDWAGSLLWLTHDGPAASVRAAAAAAGGHAMLVRADAAMRAATPAFHPQPGPLAALEARVRRAFDPAGVFETGRFGERNGAD